MSDSIKKSAIVLKKRAKELGYEIKLTHCQEILAKVNGHATRHSFLLNNEKNSQVDQKKDDIDEIISFFLKGNPNFSKDVLTDPSFKKGFMETLLTELKSYSFKQEKTNEEFIFSFKTALSKSNPESYSVTDYLAGLYSGRFKDKFYLGLIKEKDIRKENLKSFFQEPNCLMVGSMGCGKSQSAKMTIATWLLSNSERTSIYIVDLLKGASDFKEMVGYNQVKMISEQSAFFKTIDDAYNEVLLRKDELTKVGASNLIDYEAKTKNELNRIIFVIEEYSYINYQVLDFDNQYQIEGTPAYKLYNLMRVGRPYGIWFFAISQRGTASDVSKKILPMFTQKHLFKSSRAESIYLIGNMDSAEITVEQRGHCQSEYGYIIHPFLDDNYLRFLLKKYVKPNKSKNLYITD